jgi:16S rRNA C967 or C1407 C5-methylase (RsmB/RsmF family)
MVELLQLLYTNCSLNKAINEQVQQDHTLKGMNQESELANKGVGTVDTKNRNLPMNEPVTQHAEMSTMPTLLHWLNELIKR